MAFNKKGIKVEMETGEQKEEVMLAKAKPAEEHIESAALMAAEAVANLEKDKAVAAGRIPEARTEVQADAVPGTGENPVVHTEIHAIRDKKKVDPVKEDAAWAEKVLAPDVPKQSIMRWLGEAIADNFDATLGGGAVVGVGTLFYLSLYAGAIAAFWWVAIPATVLGGLVVAAISQATSK